MANRGKTHDPNVNCIKDLERLGSAKLSRSHSEYYNEGAMDLITVRDNEAAFDRYRIRPRVMRNLSSLDTSTVILGRKIRFPFAISPTAIHAMAHPDGELATSKACAKTSIPMGLSNYSTVALEKVAGAGKGNPYLMQISMLKDKDTIKRLIKRAEDAGFSALLLTLDVPYLGRRLNEYRNKFGLPEGLSLPNLFPDADVSDLEEMGDAMAYDPSFDWPEMIAFFRGLTKLPLWGKGIYTIQDAELAIHYGLDGIVVSNHGGRQLNGVPASLDVLREVAPVCKGRITIGFDGGVRRGTDIFKAIALGADVVFAGRPAIWGLAYNGAQGAQLAIDILYDEFLTTMALAGCRTVQDITLDHLSVLRADGALSRL